MSDQNVLKGKPVADAVKQTVADGVNKRLSQGLSRPGLAVILVGDDPASHSYVGHKRRACEQIGITSSCYTLPADASQSDIANLLDQLNQDPDVHGILLQLPLPEPAMANELLERIDPHKDVDGFHPYNMGRLVLRQPNLRPCTPWGVMQLLQHNDIDCAGLNATVVGVSNIVGRPMALELLLAKATVTTCHRFTRDLEHNVRSADLLIVGIGKPGVIKSEWIKPGAIVIDIGFNRLDDGTICGDIDYETAREKASLITPVPGGVGLMTVAMLMANTLQAANQIDGVATNNH